MPKILTRSVTTSESRKKEMTNAKLVCFRSGVLLQDWITFKSLALEDRSWIMNQMAEEKYGRLLNQLVNSCTTPLILVELATLIFDKAILEPTFCPIYAKLCSDMHYKLPTFTELPGGIEITIKRVLLNLCQQMFEETENLSEELRKRNAADRKEREILLKLKTLGNLRLIGELLKQKLVPQKIGHHIVQELLGDDEKRCPPEENIEAVCLYLKTTGKELDGYGLKSKQINDEYFRRLQSLSNHPQLVMRTRYMIRNIINLRSNQWVFRPEVVPI